MTESRTVLAMGGTGPPGPSPRCDAGRRRLRASSSSLRPVTGSPANMNSPSSGVSGRTLSSVDLPQPEGPIRATNSPASVVRFAGYLNKERFGADALRQLCRGVRKTF
jgi:hypothetical protein